MNLLKHLTSWLLLLTLLLVGGVANAKVASGDQTPIWTGHQADGVFNWLTHQGKSARSTTGPPGSSVVPKRGLSNTDGIRFTQDTIGSKFSDGRSVQGLIDGLKSGKVSPNDLPPIRTFQKDGLTYTLDNRRLFAAHQAGVKVKTVPATAKEVAKELPRKFTTRNQGTIIGIRGPLE